MEEDKNEFNLGPVEIHPEAYATNLFGEPTAPTSSEEVENSRALPASGLRRDSNFSTFSSPGAFNIFSFTDAVAARDKRQAWVLYQKALSSGMAPEEVFYKIVWQVKTLLTALKTKSVAETEMKPFPYNKAKSGLKNFNPGELEKISESLVTGYHKVRRGEGEMETLVEKIILTI